MKSLLIIFLLCIFIQINNASKLYVLKKPTYLNFDFNEKSIKLSEFSNLIASTIGLGSSNNQFQGLKSINPLKYPKVQIILLNNDESDNFGNSFNFINDSNIDLKSLDSSFHNQNSFAVSYKYLDSFKHALDYLNDLERKCKENKALIFTINVDDENEHVDIGVDKILNEFYKKCDLKSDDSLVYLYSTPSHRVIRQAPVIPAANNNITNKAIFYNSNYPVSFNIIFWTSLVIGLAVFGASVFICSMDPGTDTVIYRMTSQRIKKDQ